MYEDLYEENKGLLLLTARRYKHLCERDRAVSVEDLVQSGFIGLVKAAQTFDKDSGKSWTFHAKWYVVREIQDALGFHGGEMKSTHSTAISLDRNLTEDDKDGATLGDLLADDSLPASDEGLLLDEVRSSVREALEKLTDPRQRQIAELYMIEGRSMTEAAEYVGIDVARARQLYNRALSNLARNVKLRALANLDDRTDFYGRKSVGAVLRDRTSVTEAAALWRISEKEKVRKRIRKEIADKKNK